MVKVSTNHHLDDGQPLEQRVENRKEYEDLETSEYSFEGYYIHETAQGLMLTSGISREAEENYQVESDEQLAEILESEDVGRYGELNIGDEEVVIYSRPNHQAWIQSDSSTGLEDMV